MRVQTKQNNCLMRYQFSIWNFQETYHNFIYAGCIGLGAERSRGKLAYICRTKMTEFSCSTQNENAGRIFKNRIT
jgi:hypothetical protein